MREKGGEERRGPVTRPQWKNKIYLLALGKDENMVVLGLAVGRRFIAESSATTARENIRQNISFSY